MRPVDIVDGIHVRGPASPMACVTFADTFPPAPPSDPGRRRHAGVISLIWEPSDATDLAGYLVLRGEAGSATLTPLTRSRSATRRYRDETVRPGVRYVYAVVAVDKAGNRSERIEPRRGDGDDSGRFRIRIRAGSGLNCAFIDDGQSAWTASIEFDKGWAAATRVERDGGLYWLEGHVFGDYHAGHADRRAGR